MPTKRKVIAIISTALAALSLSFDAFNVFPGITWSWVAILFFVIFAIILYYNWFASENRVKSLESVRPSAVFHAFSPATAVLTPINKLGFFTRIDFSNNTSEPTGDASTAQALSAFIRVIGENGEVDAWDGRWANTNAPTTVGEIWTLNRIDLPANNQRATLDIGCRVEGEKEFYGWDNAHFFTASHRVRIPPGQYELRVTLAASNMGQRDFEFRLIIPDALQSESNSVQLIFRE
jgi:hypothetical protein